jgi:hypothetical protein
MGHLRDANVAERTIVSLEYNKPCQKYHASLYRKCLSDGRCNPLWDHLMSS